MRKHTPLRTVMAEICAAMAADKPLAGEGLVHQTEQRHAVSREPDQRAPDRQSDDEGAGPVDRIDHPAIFSVRIERAELFSQNSVVGIGFREPRADRGLSVAVGDRDGIEEIASFMVNREACPEMRQYDRPGPVGEAVGRG